MRRLQERILGPRWTSAAASDGVIWLLGVCHKVSDSAEESGISPGFSEFLQDFESRIWITYRQGFESIENSKLTTDIGWGCMIRSGQMLLAQALVCHHLGRAWRRKTNQPYPREYFEILQYFGDSPTEECPLSIHNLLDVGKLYGLAPGAWLGPYALCRTVETLAKAEKKPGQKCQQKQVLPMMVYVAAGDAEGERGGAPVLCTDDVVRICTEREDDSEEWAPLLILIPLVLGLDKINPRYLSALRATFCFPQSLGIMGGKPGASTYLVGVQDDQVLYLDPHEVQQCLKISPGNIETDTSSYHCTMVRRMPLDAIDPSLALGFYCHQREDFSDLCARASELAEKSDGAPLFTIAESSRRGKRTLCTNFYEDDDGKLPLDIDCHIVNDAKIDVASSEDEWQIL
ncbi:hypothetical protein O6H91_06G043000 [Diphasiastrum complanatum]|nr:hypothetical protein O6H91_06G043000 [Diphasiastrum complanatum]